MPRRHECRGASVVPSCRSSRCPAPYAAKCSGVITRGLARTSSCDVLPEREFPHFPICGGCEQQTCCTGQRKRHQMKVDNMYFLILSSTRLHILSFFAIAMHIILRHFIWLMSFGSIFPFEGRHIFLLRFMQDSVGDTVGPVGCAVCGFKDGCYP